MVDLRPWPLVQLRTHRAELAQVCRADTAARCPAAVKLGGGIGTVDLTVPLCSSRLDTERSQLLRLRWLTDLGAEHTNVTYSVRGFTGEVTSTTVHTHWQSLGQETDVLARIPHGAATAHCEQPRWTPERWLLPPYVLSSVLLEPIVTALTCGPALSRWPAYRIADPAWGGGTDMEGTPRIPTVFAAQGELITRPTDRRTGWRHNLALTGHAGVSGPVVRDLVIGSTGNDEDPIPPGRIIRQARVLSMGPAGQEPVLCLCPTDRNGRLSDVLVVSLSHISDLLDSGTWHGPWQRGAGAWVSRWLAIESARIPSPSSSNTLTI